MKYIYLLLMVGLTSGLNAQSTRTVLLETSESNQVAASANLLCIKEDLKVQFDADQLAIISYHIDDFSNGGGDPLNNKWSQEWAQIFSSSFDKGSIDRVSYDGLSILTNYAAEQWADTIAARINSTTDATVTMPEVLYDPVYDSIFIRTNIRFTDSIFGKVARDMRFFLYVVADGFTEDQVFESPRPCDIYPTIPQIIDTSYIIVGNDTVDTVLVEGAKDRTHNDVPILCPTGTQGTDDVISAIIEIDNEWNDIQKFAVPEGQVVGNLRVISFVANFDGNDPTKNRVINVAQASSFTVYDQDNPNDPNHPDNPENPNSRFNPDNWPASVNELNSIDYDVKISPNPVSDLGIIEYTLPNQTLVTVDILDVNGRVVQSIYSQTLGKGPQKAAFSASQIPMGVYQIRLATPETVSFKSLVITK